MIDDILAPLLREVERYRIAENNYNMILHHQMVDEEDPEAQEGLDALRTAVINAKQSVIYYAHVLVERLKERANGRDRKDE